MQQNALPPDTKIVLPGGAGLVGYNLVARLKEVGYRNLVVIDKHPTNVGLLQRIQPDITTVLADVSQPGDWERHFEDAGAVVMLQAQIGGNDYGDFVRNNVDSTRLILDLVRRYGIERLVHISSSVVESVADDFYTRTKKDQERLVIESGIRCPILRPTLMFGWFDRKHLGWLSRFMERVPFFPIPGHGRYMRQPLYAGDFCNVIISCIQGRVRDGVYNISGHEKVDYIDIILEIKRATRSRTPIVRIPYTAFFVALWVWGLFDKNPPFTTHQLAALSAKDQFEVVDWPGIFGVKRTNFRDAVKETFNDSRYSSVVLEF
ncbi:MAG: NAD-dependent epimerase/dehydratase family protein [Stagnimonas sp.]|nr:NAD-dependent epimerase/dehydratase family protein [Stagnimonas sp.]